MKKFVAVAVVCGLFCIGCNDAASTSTGTPVKTPQGIKKGDMKAGASKTETKKDEEKKDEVKKDEAKK